MRKIILTILAFILIVPTIFGELVTESRGSVDWTMVFILIILPLIILSAILFFFVKKLDYEKSKIIDSFKPTKWKVLSSIILWIVYLLWIIFSPGPMCKMCVPIQCNVNYGQYLLLDKGCHCGCTTIGNVIGNYIGLILPLVIFYFGYSILSVIFKKQKA